MLGFPGGSSGKEPPTKMQATQETWVWSLGGGRFPEEGMATHSSVLAWRIPWTEEPGRLQSMGLQSQTWLKRLSTHPHKEISSCSSTICCKGCFPFSIELILLFGQRSVDYICVDLLLGSLDHSTHLSFPSQMPHCLGYCSFMISLEVG